MPLLQQEPGGAREDERSADATNHAACNTKGAGVSHQLRVLRVLSPTTPAPPHTHR